MTVHKKAIDRAVEVLATVGAKYIIQHGDYVWESTEAPAEVVPKKITKGPKKNTRDFRGVTGYPDTLTKMAPGDVHQWYRGDYPVELMGGKAGWSSFYSSVSSTARRLFGVGNYEMEWKDKVITILRSA